MPRTDDTRTSFTPEALEVFTAVDQLIRDANRWVIEGTYLQTAELAAGTREAAAIYAMFRRKADAMQLSWLTGVVGLIRLASAFGNLRITRDGEYSLYFHQPESGFSGGLIPFFYEHGGERTKLCEWTVHT